MLVFELRYSPQTKIFIQSKILEVKLSNLIETILNPGLALY